MVESYIQLFTLFKIFFLSLCVLVLNKSIVVRYGQRYLTACDNLLNDLTTGLTVLPVARSGGVTVTLGPHTTTTTSPTSTSTISTNNNIKNNKNIANNYNRSIIGCSNVDPAIVGAAVGSNTSTVARRGSSGQKHLQLQPNSNQKQPQSYSASSKQQLYCNSIHEPLQQQYYHKQHQQQQHHQWENSHVKVLPSSASQYPTTPPTTNCLYGTSTTTTTTIPSSTITTTPTTTNITSTSPQHSSTTSPAHTKQVLITTNTII